MWSLKQYGKDSTQQYSGIENNLFPQIDFTKEIKHRTVYLEIDKDGRTQNLEMIKEVRCIC